MKRIFILLCIVLATTCKLNAQIFYGKYILSLINVNFSDTSGNSHYIIQDHAINKLWQIGKTYKHFFSTDSIPTNGIMTDTVHPYTVNANNWFVLRIDAINLNEVISIYHRYETDSLHAGGIVEYSLDSGLTWQNIIGPCTDTPFSWLSPSITTENFYSFSDTLLSGEPCFKGRKESTCSQLQFFYGLPERLKTTSGCGLGWHSWAFLRFRFKSDASVGTMSGWMIDSITMRTDFWEGSVKEHNSPDNYFAPKPNPSLDGIFSLPEISNQTDYTISVYNTMGKRILHIPYSRILDLSKYSKGLYFYMVTNGLENYKGKIVIE